MRPSNLKEGNHEDNGSNLFLMPDQKQFFDNLLDDHNEKEMFLMLRYVQLWLHWKQRTSDAGTKANLAKTKEPYERKAVLALMGAAW